MLPWFRCSALLRRVFTYVLTAAAVVSTSSALRAAALDTVVFGDAASESSHAMSAPDTEVIGGALGEPARRALPQATVDLYGGSFTFTMAVDPVRRNYVTVKLWGSDDTDIRMGRLYLYVPVNGTDYQVGYRHEGDYMPLSVTGTKPPLPGRFFYSTTLLPLAMTQGKTSLTLKIVSAGRLYGLGAGGPPTGNYQFTMDRPSRGLYRAYTHVDPFLEPVGEVQGSAPVTIARPTPDEGVMAPGGAFFNGVTNRINNRLNAAISVTSFTTADVEYLARAYSVPELASYQNPAIIDKVVAVIDAFATDYYANPTTSVSTGGNEGWGGRFGNIGHAIHRIESQLTPYLDVVVNYGAAGGDKTRRQAWGDMIHASREFGRTTRDNRYITNQTILADESIYKANKGLLALGDSRAFVEVEAQRYLKEACGLLPWLGSDLTAGGSSKKYGSNYYQVTSKGLTREWGYLGNAYGEMAYHIADWYLITGNPEFLQQAAKMAKARVAFRRPSMTVNGADHYRTMEAIGLLAWRGVDESDGEFEDAIVYGDSSEWTRGMRLAAVTGDPALIGYAKQMLADNQYFASLTVDSRYYTVIDALNVFADYATVKATADSGIRLPMTDGQPDFAWADEENRILALKRGNDRLWITSYWQAKTGTGINGIARFHFSTPTYDQYGVLETVPVFTAGGSFTRPASFIDKPEATQWAPPNPPTQAYGGEILPLGAAPSDATDDAPFRGKADFYAFRYGRYLVGINAHPSNAYTLKTPGGFSSASDLLTGASVSGTVAVAPLSTVALDLGTTSDPAPVPTAPLYVGANGTAGAMNVSWSPSSGATSFIVKRATSANGVFTVVASGVTGTSYSDTTIAAGSAYYYRVVAVNAAGESYESMVAKGLTLGLPAPWADVGIGNITTAGSASFDDGLYIIKGAGTDIGGTADGIHFGYRSLAGDGVLIARLASRVIGGSNNDKVGLMMRESNAANARMAIALIDAGNGLARFASRSATGGSTTYVSGPAISVPRWFKLQRAGNVFTGSVSADGVAWTTISSATIAMTSTINVGFAVCSRDAAFLNTSTFDNVSLVAAPQITSPTAAALVIGQPFSYTITATNNPTSFSATGLPAGLTLDATTGVISGTPTAMGSTVTLGATNAIGSSSATLALQSVELPVISVNLKTSAANGLSPTALAGVQRVANWNNLVGPTNALGNTVTVANPNDQTGSVTVMPVTVTAGSSGGMNLRTAETSDDATLYATVFDHWNGTPGTLTVTGIPYPTYDVVFYVYNDGAARGGRFTVGATTYYIRTGIANPTSTGTGYVRSTDTNATFGAGTQQGNYVRFTGLSGNLSASFVALNMGDSVQRLKIAGFQIIATSMPTPGTVAPTSPTGLTIASGNGQATITWKAAVGATSYTVKRSASPNGPFTTLASDLTSLSFTDLTAINGETYYYVVSASNSVGTSPDSKPLGATPIDPAGVAAFGVNLRAFNTYGMPVSDTAGVVRLPYWNNLVGPAAAGETVSTNALTDSFGIPLASATATWVAGNGGGMVKLGTDAVTVGPALNDKNLFSSVFDQFDGTASTLTVTGIPYASYDAIFYVYDDGASRGGTITANGNRLAIRGGAGNPDVDGVGYVRSTDSVNASGSSVQQGNYVRFTGLTGDLTATFVATNVGSTTMRLKIAGFQIISNTPVAAPTAVPVAPVGFTASGGNTQVGLNWSHSVTATSYKIYKGSALLATVASPLTSYADTAVTNGSAYSYTVSAVNAVGEGAQSAPASATPAAPDFTLPQRTVYQYSIPMTPVFGSWTADPQRRAYLWVPPGSTKLQGVVLGLHNMLEKPMFDDPAIRQACAEAHLGIIFISPGDSKTWTPNGVGNYTPGPVTSAIDLDPNNYKSADINPATGTNFATDINPATGTRFANQTEQAGAEVAALLAKLAAESGYAELQHAPILLAGHSAASPFTWVRGLHTTSALGGRIFAMLPYKGTFPGSVPAGMPILHVASEWQEISNWGNTWELGDAPALRTLRGAGADRLVSAYVQPGSGHYQYSESQSGPLALFIKKAAQRRIPADWSPTGIPTLNTIDPTTGVLVDVTKSDSGNCAPVAYAAWVAAGKNPVRAYWYLDAELAQAVCDAQNAGFGKRPQMINAFQNATTLASLASQSNGTGNVSLSVTLQADGATFKVRGASMNQSPVPRLFHGGAVGIASGPILFKANGSGALKQTGPDTFQVWMDRGTVIKQGQPWEPFIIARHPGDANFREADRPVFVTTSAVVNNITGAAQTITFPAIPDQYSDDLQPITLNATASSGRPVQYWVVSGPYRNDETNSALLIPDQLPANAVYPMRVVVGAWQWGKPGTTAAATPVYQEFFIRTPPPEITSPTSASGVYGAAFTYTIAATNSPMNFTATGLPGGLTLDPIGGVISGTPATAGDFTVILGATNAGGTGSETLTLSIAKAAATVTLNDLAAVYDGSGKVATATTAPANLAVSFTYDGANAAPVGAGSYAVTATISDANYDGSASGTLVIAKATASVSLSDLLQTYSDAPKTASATTDPANLAVTFTYDGSSVSPTNAGSYAVVAAIDELNYAGSATGTLEVAKAPAFVSLSNLAQTYDGVPKPVTVATAPGGLPVSLTYNGSVIAPTDAGSYAVAATVLSSNYTGSASGTLEIAKATATLALAPLTQRYDGTPKPVTATTSPEGLTVTLTYDGVSEAPIYPGTHAVAATIDDPNYTATKTDTLTITITALVRHAPMINGLVDGSVQMLSPEYLTLNGSGAIAGDLLVPGLPNVQLNGAPSFVGTKEATGSASPANYALTLNSGSVLRYAVRRVDAIAMPAVTAPAAPTGTRSVTLNSPSDSAGDFSTVRDLALGGNAGIIAVPPGAYGNVSLTGSSGLVLGVVGATEPSVYSLQNLQMSNKATVQIVGPVVLTLANGFVLDGKIGNASHPGWLTLQVYSGGLTLNSHSEINGAVVAPTGSVVVNGVVRGSISADSLTLNSNAVLEDAP
jgi:fibronectin type 3 domain-containing protein/regulation of enolase protein 1 (concanavalin A-like superfamily)